MKRIFAALLLLLMICQAHAAPKKDLWVRWQVNNPLSTKKISYTEWANFLKKYIHTNSNGINLVAYSRVTDEDKYKLIKFLNRMARIHIDSYNRREQEAYWINLYNALTVDVVLRHYPVSSIRKIRISGLFGSGPWGAKLIKVEGISITLNDIEHRILRPIWNDQRLHYALNCASISCPNLQNVPFTGENLENLLNQGAKTYINSAQGAQLKNDRLTVSSIYYWYKADFGGTDDDIIDWMEIYAKPVLRDQLKFVKKISGDYYNWTLNAWPPQKEKR